MTIWMDILPTHFTNGSNDAMHFNLKIKQKETNVEDFNLVSQCTQSHIGYILNLRRRL